MGRIVQWVWLLGFIASAVAGSGEAVAEVFRCSVKSVDGEFVSVVEADIVIPHPMAADKSIWLLEQRSHEPVTLVSPRAAVGSIELLRTDAFRDAKKTHARQGFELVVTQLPSSNNSLIGFFMEGTHPTLVKADLFNPRRQVTMARTLTGGGLEILIGECK